MKRTAVLLQTGTFLSSAALTTMASGFRLPEVSAAGKTLSNALVANPDVPGALPYNPATMAFQKQEQWRCAA